MRAAMVRSLTPLTFLLAMACAGGGGTPAGSAAAGAAAKVYIAPGEKDEFYAFMSGGLGHPEGSLALSLDPLALIVSCILAEPALERARRSVQAFKEEPLTLVLGHEIVPTS